MRTWLTGMRPAVAKQTNPERSYMQLLHSIVDKKGLIGILDGASPPPPPATWPRGNSPSRQRNPHRCNAIGRCDAMAGFVPWGIIQAGAKGAMFGVAQATALNSLKPMVEQGTLSESGASIVAGGIGGGFQGLVLSPALLLKTRVMTNPIFRESMPLSETTRQSMRIGMEVIRSEGPAALMKGSLVFSSKRVADWTTRYFFATVAENVIYKRHDPHRKLTAGEEIASSLIGGVLSTVVTIPIDVIVAQIQQQKNAGKKVPVVQLFVDKYRSGGINAIAGFATGGFVARVLHVACTTALLKTGSSWIYQKIYGDK